MPDKPHLFVSYSRDDFQKVRSVVDAVSDELKARDLPVDVWMDLANLSPGEQWDLAITDALKSSIGFLFFVSPRSIGSDWVRRELEIAASSRERLIIPIILRHSADLPAELALRQWIDLSEATTRRDIVIAAAAIADAIENYLRATPKPKAAVSAAEAPSLAADIASQVRTPPV